MIRARQATTVMLTLAALMAMASCARTSHRGPGGSYVHEHREVYRLANGHALEAIVVRGADQHARERRPAILFLHGGAWLYGRPDEFLPHARHLADRGMVAISVEYRTRWRHGGDIIDGVADARAAVRWVRADAERLGVDPDRIVVAGTSAGGHLALATVLINDFDLPPADGIPARPMALVLYAPVSETRFEGWPDTPRNVLTELRYDYLLRGYGERASPMTRIHSPLPPMLVIHAEDDRTVPIRQSEELVEQARRVGGEARLVRFESGGHRFYKLARHRQFQRLLAETTAFLEELELIAARE